MLENQNNKKRRKDKMLFLRGRELSQLHSDKIALFKELFNLRMQKGTDQLKRNHIFKNIRRNIARINSVVFEIRNKDVLRSEK